MMFQNMNAAATAVASLGDMANISNLLERRSTVMMSSPLSNIKVLPPINVLIQEKLHFIHY